MKNQTLKPGQTVWVCHFTLESPKTKAPSAVIREREFYRYSNPSYAKGELRAVVGPTGKRGFEDSPAPFGIGYKPEMVYETREAARLALTARMEAHIESVLKLRDEVCKA